MKKFIILVMAIAIALTLSSCNKGGEVLGGVFGQTCDKCEKIAELQAEAEELAEKLNTREATLHEGSAEVVDNEERLDSINEQISVLMQHDCPLPPEKVTNVEYVLGKYNGTYTGEMKAGVAHGKGSFEGIYHKNKFITLKYDGDFVGGELEGYGVYILEDSQVNHIIHYEGEFHSNCLTGQATEIETYGKTTTEKKGEFKNGRFMNGEYTEKDSSGVITDYGTYKDGNISYSAKTEQEKKRNQQQAEFIIDVFDWIF
ncbi:MAG: hypothetical protein ACI4J7_03900 [Ruminiclostridium sp.]